MKIIKSKYLPPLRRHIAINLFGVLFVHPDVRVNKRLLNHERIHTAQMRELAYLPFYILYLLEWMIRLMPHGNAYRSISFEREAYSHDSNLYYLKHRKHYAWLKYMKRKNIRHKFKRYDKRRN